MEKELTQQSTDLIKVVIFGPESTGKTTLSRQLATHYKTLWVPEFAREYLQEKWNASKEICQKEDILPIAKGQIQLKKKLGKKANKLLICDTDVLETKVYSEQFYNGFFPAELDEIIKDNEYDLYLLTYIDTPWIADDLRDRPNERKKMFTAFENALLLHKKNYILLEGKKETRLKKAITTINQLIANES